MNNRKIIDVHNVEFMPFDRYGSPVPKMSWHIISYDQVSGQGSYVLKMDPGAQTVPHTHMGFEEFFIVEGELIDSDGTVFNKGEFVSFKPASQHSSYSEKGALIIVFQRGLNIPLKEK
ncbi:cupin domain-containing protein [Candidatus Thioglobus sp.]|nr:cupin domain-containing protein [Candidatus Thioglobus sp.]